MSYLVIHMESHCVKSRRDGEAGPYGSADMMVITRSVTDGSEGSGECALNCHFWAVQGPSQVRNMLLNMRTTRFSSTAAYFRDLGAPPEKLGPISGRATQHRSRCPHPRAHRPFRLPPVVGQARLHGTRTLLPCDCRSMPYPPAGRRTSAREGRRIREPPPLFKAQARPAAL